MNIKMTGPKAIGFSVLFTLIYYVWLLSFRSHPFILTLGGNLLSIGGILIALVWLWPSLTHYAQSNKKEPTLWLFIFWGTASVFLAEITWFYYENILAVEVPFPGLADVFYLLQLFFYLLAVGYKVVHPDRKYSLVKFLFDLLIIMIVATILSWHFIINPIIAANELPLAELVVSIAYPVGDLLLMFGLISIYYLSKRLMSNQALLLLFIGILVQVFADSSYLYLMTSTGYDSGALIDPLFILAILLMASGYYYKDVEPKTSHEKLNKGRLHYLLPYANVLLLIVLLFTDERQDPILLLGSILTFFLILIRQVFVLLENRYLIHEYEKKTVELEISEQRYKSLFNYHPDAVFSVNADGYFTSVNRKGALLIGLTEDQIIGAYSLSFIDEAQQRTMAGHLDYLVRGETRSHELTFRLTNTTLHLQLTLIPIIVEGSFVGIFGIGKDITKQKEQEKQVRHLAFHDSLTGLANRLRFERKLKRALEQAEKDQESIYVCFLDLDNFKSINDNNGHRVGDQLLIEVARRLRVVIDGREGLISRTGGDEFVIYLSDIDRKEVINLAETLVDVLSQVYHVAGKTILTSPSLGIAIFPNDATNYQALVDRADEAMYQVKAAGKGAYRFYDGE